MRIFKWSKFSDWERTVRGLMGNYLDDDVVAAVRNDSPNRIFSDDLSWLNTAVSKVHRIRLPDSSQLLTRKLLEYYSHVAAFHGCRPTSTDAYSQHGLQACNPAKLVELALEIFGDTPRVRGEIERLSDARSGLSYENHNRDKVFFTLTQEELVESCGHTCFTEASIFCVSQMASDRAGN